MAKQTIQNILEYFREEGRNNRDLDACENQQPPVTKLRFQDLDDSTINWSDFKINRRLEILTP